MGGTLVVAGLWARPLAESACRAGWQVIALDLFGDADTRRACRHWWRIGDPAAFAIAPVLLREALQRAAREPDVIGWVAGSGFEGQPELLDLQVPGLPLLGMGGDAVRRLRAPASFFGTLDHLGLAYPEVALQAPVPGDGWLVKDAGGSGGWHIRTAADGARAAGAAIYWQRLQAGEPMSALVLADGARARLVAINRLVVRPLAGLPFVFHGALGPIREDALTRHIEEGLSRLVPAFGLRGLASLDFIAREDRAWLLEVNPRPSATMVLHEHAWPLGLMHAHVRAVRGDLPSEPAAHPPGVRGCLTVFADRACRVGLALAAELAQSRHCHDLPPPGSGFEGGEPVCSVSARGSSAEAVLAVLDARAVHVRDQLAPTEQAA